MKKIYFSAAVALLLATASCQNEVVVEDVQGREFRVEVSVGGGSRTHIGQNGTMTWSEGDQIYVGNIDDPNTGGVLTLVSGAGTPNAVFSGLVKGGSDLQYSVFPVPEEDGKIDLTSRKAGQPNAPLISTFDGSGSLTFDKTCAVVRIDVSGTKGGTLTLNSEEKNLSGTAVVVYNSTTSKYELQYTRGTGGVTITDLPQDGYIDVPVITKAVNNGTDDNLQENAEVPFVIGVAGEELEFTAKVQTGQVTATGVPSIDVEEGGEPIAYTSISTIEEFNNLVNNKNNKEVAVKLTKDLNIEISAWNPPYYLGHENTEKIMINGDGHTLNFVQNNSDWNYIRCNNDQAKWFIKNAKLTNSGHNNGPWNRHNIRFYNEVELTDIESDKAIALLNDGTLTRVYISDTHPNNSAAYGLWITAEGQTVTLTDCDIVAHSSKNADRGIAIKDEYVDNPEIVTLNISGTTFVTQEKAAVLVTSSAGAVINWRADNDISQVKADDKYAVWIDEDRKDYINLVTVAGCQVKVEE